MCGFKISWITENAAFIISFLAFVVTGIQAWAARTQNRLSVKPFLYTLTNPNNQLPTNVVFDMWLLNAGSGPAIVSDYFIRYAGKEYRDNKIFDFFESELGKGNCWAYMLRPQSAVPSKSERSIFKVYSSAVTNQVSEDKLIKLLDEIEFVVRYQSQLGEEGKYSSKSHSWDS